MSSKLVAALLGVAVVTASPALTSRESITALWPERIQSYTPYTWYASTAYCTPAQTLDWTCDNCQVNSNYRPVASGGDGDSVQYWYVGYDPGLDTVIVAHQGISPSEMDLDTDVDFFLVNLDSTLFPGISSDIEVHNWFAEQQALTATDVRAAVETTMSRFATTSITMVGHSLGAAIALIDSVYLPLWLPAGTTFQTIGYGLPRVGNQAFANYVDAKLSLTHINNKKDPIPISPAMDLGFVHPAGEVHIKDSGEWVACPGQDNPDTQCIVGAVPQVWDGNLGDNNGPYNDVTMGC